MKIIVIGLIAILAAFSSGQICQKFTCTDDKLSENACAMQTLQEVFVRACKSDKYVCPIPRTLEEESLCTEKISIKDLLPGEYCSENKQCISGECKENKCNGKGKDGECKGDEECNVGFYCKGGKCAEVVPAGGNCAAQEKCDPSSLCYDGVCTLYAQIENGNNATMAAVCKSYYIYKGKCSEGPKLTTNEHKCPEDNKCKYTFTFEEEKMEINTNCLCGRTKENITICPKGRGDVEDFGDFSTYISKNKKSPCHVKRGSPLCLYDSIDNLPTEFYRAYKAYIELTQPANIIDNQECIKKVYNTLYWTAIEKIEEDEEDDRFGLYLFLGIAIGAVFVIAILLLVIYLKRRKSDEDEDIDETTGGDRLTA